MESILELTVQRAVGTGWPVVAEHHRAGQFLPVRSEGLLTLEGEPASARPASYGQRLGAALFTGAIRDAYVAARGDAPVRVWLCVEDPALRSWRWEWLCAPVDGSRWDFLSLDQRALYSLYLPSLTDRPYPPIGRQDLRALVLVANPVDPEGRYGLSRFDAAMTATRLQAIFDRHVPCDLLARVKETVGPPTLGALLARLAAGTQAGPYSILHLVCHGRFEPVSGETWLYFEQPAGTGEPLPDAVTATQLLECLARVHQLPYLVFLSVCESSAPEAEQRLGGLAQRLVRELGIPAVVGMTEPVTITTAQALSDAFYKRLITAPGAGAVDRALVEAYAGLASRLDVHVPALYSRLGDQPLFSVVVDRSLTAGEIRTGLDRLEALLVERAPVLYSEVAKHRQALEPWLSTDPKVLSQDAQKTRATSLEVITEISQDAIDLSFHALAAGEPVPAYDARQPFRGLSPFRSEDREFFFGRDALVGTLARRLAEDPFLPVLGPSGSGKSSVILAGLVPSLQQEDPSLQVLYLTPGSTPLEQLYTVQADLGTGPALYVVDQFEEVFTACRDEGQRRAFIDALLELVTRARVIVTMRADFWGECAPYLELKARMQARQELIAPMTTAELRAAMEQQAAKVGLRFEADLSHAMLDEVAGEPGAMPLLQHALLELWKRRHGRWLRAAEYRAIGGVKQAITETADRLYMELPQQDQESMRDIFLRLTQLDEQVAPGQERRDTRRRVPFTELVPAHANHETIKALVKRIADAVLVTTSRNSVTNQDEVEVVHEALIRYWTRLQRWLNENQDQLQLRDSLREAAAEWAEKNTDESLLVHRGSKLEAAEAFLWSTTLPLTDRERQYVLACIALRNREASLRQHQIARERAWSRRILYVVVTAVIVAAGLLIWAGKQSRLASSQVRRASALTLASESQSIRDEDAELGALLATEAVRLSDGSTPEVEEALRKSASALGGVRLDNGAGYPRVGFSPDGRWLFTAGNDEAEVWQFYEGARVPVLQYRWPSDIVRDFSFDNSNATLFVRDDANSQLLDLVHPDESRWIPRVSKALTVSSIDDTATWAATVEGVDRGDIFPGPVNVLKLWNIARTTTSAVAELEHDSPVTAAEFGPGNLLGVADEGNQVTIWRFGLGKLEKVRVLVTQREKRGRSISRLQFSRDGVWLAAITDEPLFGEASVVLWNLQQQDALPDAVLGGHAGAVVFLFSADNQWAVGAGTGGHHRPNKTVSLASLRMQKPRILQLEVAGGTNALDLSPDGAVLAAATDDGLKLWSLTGAQPESLDVDKEFRTEMKVVRFSPSGRWLALGGRGTTWLKQMVGPERLSNPIPLRGNKEWIQDITMSPDSKWLVTTTETTTRLWDLVTPQGFTDPIRIPTLGNVTARTPDGKVIDARQWDPLRLATNYYRAESPGVDDAELVRFVPERKVAPRTISPWSERSTVLSANGFSSDAEARPSPSRRWVVAWEKDSADLSLLDLRVPQSRQVVAKLNGHKPRYNQGFTVVFSDNERWLATAHRDDTDVQLWDLSVTPPASKAFRLEGEASSYGTGTVDALAFSPAGDQVAFRGFQLGLWYLRPPASPVRIRIPEGTFGTFGDVAFSQDGKFLLGIHHWTSGSTIAAPHTLAWRSHIPDLLRAITVAVGRNMNVREWQRFLPGTDYRVTFPEYPPSSDVFDDLMQKIESARAMSNRARMSSLYETAVQVALQENNPSHCNAVAWEGALDGLPRLVLAAADKAVQLAPHADNYFDTRAVVRFFAGDRTGAIDDFRRVVQLAGAISTASNWTAKRSKWLTVLENGGTPFTVSELRQSNN